MFQMMSLRLSPPFFVNHLGVEMERTAGMCAGCETEADIIEKLGQPDESDVSTIPTGSGWGMQGFLRYKIAAGELVQQWLYYGIKNDLCVWFAIVSDTWQVTLVLPLPKGFARVPVRKDFVPKNS
jgi:hypothetical protein